MTVYASNLLRALRDAIEVQKVREAHLSYTMDSAYVGGLKEIIEALEKGETAIYITPE